jgi:hypothetical protein
MGCRGREGKTRLMLISQEEIIPEGEGKLAKDK